MSHAIDFKKIFDALPNAYLLVTPEFTVIDVNETCLRIFAMERSLIVGHKAMKLFFDDAGESSDQFLTLLRTSYQRTLVSRAVETVPMFKRSIPITMPGGIVLTDKYLKLVHTPILEENGQVSLIITCVADVSADVELNDATTHKGRINAPACATPPLENGTALSGTETSQTKSSEGLRILFVEDNDDLRDSTSQVMEQLGYVVTAVGDAEDALLQLKENEFDVLFSDLTLPKMTGKELATEVSRRYPKMKIVISSGYGRAMADLRGLDAVMLPKPYRIADLKAVLN